MAFLVFRVAFLANFLQIAPPNSLKTPVQTILCKKRAIFTPANKKTMKKRLLHIYATGLLLLMAATGFSQKAPATIGIDSIDKLYVTDAETALEHIGILRKECETIGWTQCSKDHLEAVESLIHLRQGDHRNAQKHAYAALAAPQEEDKTWRLIAYQTLCESFHATGNYALLGKYAMMMNLEANQPTFSALAHIYEAQALGRTGAFRQALAKADTATIIMENSMSQNRNEQFNALLLYYLSLDTKIQVCREAGMQQEAYAYAQQYLRRLEQEERKGYRDMDENGFKTERLALFLQLANICVALGKDGSQWFNEGMALCQELEHPAEITSEAAAYLFATRQYTEYERIIVPALQEFVKKAPTQAVMRMLWQWINILAASNRQAELEQWTAKGMEISANLVNRLEKSAGTDFLMAYESELKDKEIEVQQAALKANRLRMAAIASFAILIAAGFTVTFIMWKKQKKNIQFLYRQIEENRQKERLAEKQMLLANHPANVLPSGSDESEEANLALLAALHAFLKENDRFRDSELTMEQIARQLAVRQKKLNATLQTLKGTTLVGYVRDMRLEYACSLLHDHPDMKVETVALQSGYNTPRQFMRIFKEKYNLTPSEYRHASRQN